MNRVRALRLPVIVVIAIVGTWCMIALAVLAIMWTVRVIGAQL